MSVKVKAQDKNTKITDIDAQIMKCFDIKKKLGKGAYGIVWKATDKKTQQIVAVKKIFDAFRNETDAQRTFREIMFLRAFRNHPNIIQLHSIHRALNHMDIYLSFEFMESDLHNVIKRGSILKDIHKRYVMYQLFNATQFIHSGNVIHRDMKPSNILVDSKCRCKIADFGLARSISPNFNTNSLYKNQKDPADPCLTDYVATRWYRAPEILISSKKYTMGIDLWSLGCILGEMIRGKPLFPGTCTINQIERIISALPEATENDIKSVGAGFGACLLNKQTTTNPKLDELLLGSSDDAKQLVKSLLVLDPMKRLTAKQALSHKYIERFRNTSPEPELNTDIVPPFRDDVQLTVSEYRSKLYEIMSSNEKNGYANKKPMDKRELQADLESSVIVIPSTISIKTKSIFTNSSTIDNSKPRINNQSIGDSNLLQQPHKPQFNVKKVEKKNSNCSQNLFTRATSTAQNKNNIKKNQLCPNNKLLVNNELNEKANNFMKNCQIKENNFLDRPMTTVSKQVFEGQNSFENGPNQRSSMLHKKNLSNINRRQSLDSCLVSDSNGYPIDEAKLIEKNMKISPSMSKYKIMTALQNRQKILDQERLSLLKQNSMDKYKKTKLQQPIMEPSKYPHQKFIDEQQHYENRLKNLEEKIRKHKNNSLKLAANNSSTDKLKQGLFQNSNKEMTMQIKKSYSNNNFLISDNFPIEKLNKEQRSDSMQKIPVKIDLTAYRGCDGDSYGSHNNRLIAIKQVPSHTNYGVIKATDLFKLRSSDMMF